MSEPAVMTVSDLSRRWRCARSTVMALIRRGELAAFKLSERGYRVRLDEVRRLEEQRAKVA